MAKTTTTRPPRAKQGPRNKSVAAKKGKPQAFKLPITDYLLLLEAYYQPELSEMPWASEDDRWAELLFCLLYEASGQADAAIARSAVATLRYLGLATLESLSGKDASGNGNGAEPTGEGAATVTEILRRHGFEDPEGAMRLLAHTASSVDKAWGQVQVFLYNHGQAMIDELAETIVSDDAPEDTVRASAALWLQNTLNLPVMVERPAITSLRRRFDVSVDELMDAADKVGLNVAILDDLVSLSDGDEEFEAWLEAALAVAGSAEPA